MMLVRSYRFSNNDGILYDWGELNNEDFRWNSILIGNGASINVWDGFNYNSIFDHAAAITLGNPLTESDISLFNSLNTHNFEQVLSSLNIARIINQALGLDHARITERYTSIKSSLIGTISEIHIPWRLVPNDIIERIRTEILNYRYIYTTNYDLMIYWSIMHQNNPNPFTDYFFCREFDSSDTEVFDDDTNRILYLHGALHLYKLPSGTTLKRTAEFGRNLLDLFGQPYPGAPDAVPLIVSEGTSDDKLSTINQSDYLSFAFYKFSENAEDMVIFGHSLSNSDMHIVNAMQKWGERKLAISILPDTVINIKQKQASWVAKLPEAKLYFFDATTQPLGSPNQKVIP
jgi:hypothetical protein